MTLPPLFKAQNKNENNKMKTSTTFFSQSVSLTQYVVLSVRLFQLASESSHDVVARRRSDY